ncbi:transcriptional regulator [Bacillus sp. J14TS2]|uniref:sugar-binding transcriptional regulator n=1 Tax=Bacillus sp. J14TS2 TaxID=2807188 RepID=UPI001B05BE0D|nr:sugar-binding domain-containing protein [Bacillus sp. J14TS2]GIN70837.1 transcriptional regulator [Bacillus sp. J14TS2]
MHNLLKLQSKLVPDMLSVMQNRYQILRSISLTEPVGRRTLAHMLGTTERILRSEAEFLKAGQLIRINTAGMSVTDKGKKLLAGLEDVMRELTGISETELALKTKLGIKKVVIVSGDSDESLIVKEELGKACAEALNRCFEDQQIIAVTGGTTMACTAEMLTAEMGQGKDLLFVPARGGLGEDLKNQANVICATMAEKTNGMHRVLYVPDQVSLEVQQSLLKEPAIMEVVEKIKSADIIVHGIGEAITMANRRATEQNVMKKLIGEKAVGEAFGYYFDEKGEIVHKVPTIGLRISDLFDKSYVIAAAGGKSKAKAIKSYFKSAPESTILITDEGAAKSILKDIS